MSRKLFEVIRIYRYSVLENHLIIQLIDFTSILNDMLPKGFFCKFWVALDTAGDFNRALFIILRVSCCLRWKTQNHKDRLMFLQMYFETFYNLSSRT